MSLYAFTALAVMSCGQVKVEKSIESKPAEKSEMADSKEAHSELNVDSLVSAADQRRTEIENAETTPMEVFTSDLKEKIKQKWERIHFYTLDGNIVRIKTYPYENISKRTEEFYLQDGELFMAVIEDDGTGERGKTAEEIDKIYYIADGELVHEINKSEEQEYSLRKSDAEELQAEVREYIQIFNKQ